MKKISLICFVIFVFITNVYCRKLDECLVLFGESCQNINEITIESDNLIKKNYQEIWKFAEETFNKSDEWKIEDCKIFQEKIDENIFYRFVFGTSQLTFDFILDKINSVYTFEFDLGQLFFYKYNDKLFLLSKSYIIEKNAGDGTVHSYKSKKYQNVSVVKNKYQECEILIHETEEQVDEYINPETDEFYRTEDGESIVNIYKISSIINQIKKNKTNEVIVFDCNVQPDVYVSGCRTLLDNKSPFRYTINNAFDNNPNTSFVENTIDNNITIRIINLNKKKYKSIEIINGFSENESLYKLNNRIKSFSVNNDQFFLKDIYNKNFTTFDLFTPTRDIAFVSDTLYEGSECNDTCISEISVKDF